MTVMVTVYHAPGWAEGRHRPGSADPAVLATQGRGLR